MFVCLFVVQHMSKCPNRVEPLTSGTTYVGIPQKREVQHLIIWPKRYQFWECVDYLVVCLFVCLFVCQIVHLHACSLVPLSLLCINFIHPGRSSQPGLATSTASLLQLPGRLSVFNLALYYIYPCRSHGQWTMFTAGVKGDGAAFRVVQDGEGGEFVFVCLFAWKQRLESKKSKKSNKSKKSKKSRK